MIPCARSRTSPIRTPSAALRTSSSMSSYIRCLQSMAVPLVSSRLILCIPFSPSRQRVAADPANRPVRSLGFRRRLPIDAPLRDLTSPPLYQRMAPEAARLRAAGLSDHAIGLRFRVTDKTAAKAIRWFLGRLAGPS